ncbi:uncharacterized protein LOC134245163 [Saccostrea cucullata]|uniref:uncharacterized protein LOC134245163 n=1 Tax=Saccostrea cuccullata TaxID=36930 RepID=UPI002ED349CD
MASATSAPSVSSPTVPTPIPTAASSIPHPVSVPSPPAAPSTISPITMHPVPVQVTASAPSIPAPIPNAASSIPPASAPSTTPATSHLVPILSPSTAPLITLPTGPTTASSVETPTSPQSPVPSITYSERIAVIGQNHVSELGNSVANGSVNFKLPNDYCVKFFSDKETTTKSFIYSQSFGRAVEFCPTKVFLQVGEKDINSSSVSEIVLGIQNIIEKL